MQMTDDSTVYSAFCDTATCWPDRPFLNVLPETAAAYGIASGEITYAAMSDAVARLIEGYRAAGLQPGARVMVLLENRPSFVAQFLALNALGAGIVPVNPDLRAAELTHMAAMADPVLAVALPDRAADLVAAGVAAGRPFAVIGPDDAPPALPGPADAAPDAVALRREAAMLFTSGTTGAPKGCVLSNLYFLNAGRWYAGAGGLCAMTDAGERMITPLPVFHMNAMSYSLMAMVAVGGCLTLLDRFHPRTWWDSVRASGATCLHYLGVMPSILMKLPPDPADRDHGVRFGFGAGVAPELHAPFEARFGFPLVEAWAMTETGAGAVICANHLPRRVGAGALGRPGPDLAIRVVADDGTEAAADQPGELLVRHAGPDPRRGFFDAYHKQPEASAGAWQGGWFHTGDIVRRDASGEVYFVDRRKNVIRRSGENIAAVEVEAILLRAPGVRAVAAAATPDPLRGDEVFACIVTDGPGDAGQARGLVDWMLGQAAYYKAPGYIAFVEALPVTATQKIQRGELKAMVARLRDDPGTHDLRHLKKRDAA